VGALTDSFDDLPIFWDFYAVWTSRFQVDYQILRVANSRDCSQSCSENLRDAQRFYRVGALTDRTTRTTMLQRLFKMLFEMFKILRRR